VTKGLKPFLNVLNAVGGSRLNNNRHLMIEEEKSIEIKALLDDGTFEQAKQLF